MGLTGNDTGWASGVRAQEENTYLAHTTVEDTQEEAGRGRPFESDNVKGRHWKWSVGKTGAF